MFLVDSRVFLGILVVTRVFHVFLGFFGVAGG